MKKILVTCAIAMMATLGFAQRFTDKVDRGIVAVPASSGNFISWRVLSNEYYDVTYNLYCNGSPLKQGLKVSNYTHTAGNASSKYYVIPVVRGVEKPELKSKEVSRWENGYLDIPVARPTGRDGNYADDYYTLNDVSLGDLTGNGVVEFIVKRPASDARNYSSPNTYQKIHFNQIDCYDISGNRLWWIDLGPNMISGPDEQWDCVCYDWDMDGKAEVILRVQDGAIIHFADGTSENIGNMTLDTRNTVDQENANLSYTNTGNEYLLYLEGATGKPYNIGPEAHPHYMAYPIPRGSASEWGDSYGHRSTKHYWGAPYLNGRTPSMFFGRGAYTQHKFAAYDVDIKTHKLTRRWYWENTKGWDSPWFGNGFHNFAIGDVDWDGRDEIIFGSMIIDDNGKGLCTTGNGHGDAQHCSDFDPYRHGSEQFTCNEDEPACTYYNATTGEVYYRFKSSGDDGRALCGNFSNNFPGSMGRTTQTGLISTVADKEITSGAPSTAGANDALFWSHLNQRIYWDGDLQDEVFDSPGSEARAGAIYKPDGGRLFNADGSNTNNSSKNNPGAIADIFGDWREELIMRAGNTKIRIYTTNIPTSYRIPTLWSDHQYRNAMVWQSMGYNQPPHKSYFLGEMEGITVAPPTNTMEGRTEVPNGGTITTTDEHLIVCDTLSTNITIQDGASPYMVTFNVPSHVQGNAESNILTKPAPTYEYLTCNVTGGALTGETRVVKTGDGILTLPKVNMTYTGETNIWAGTLNFDGTLEQSDLWLNRFAELNSNGGHFKSIKADYAAIIRPGGENSLGNITVDNTLTLGFGSRLVLDLYSDGIKADHITAKTLKIENKSGTAWEQYGPKYLRPVIQVVEHFAEGATTLAEGKYIIGKVEELNGSLANIKIEGITDLKSSLTLDEDMNLVLTISNIRPASEIVWTGAASNAWDFAKSENFYVASDESKTADVFVKDDIVDFTDEATKLTVNVGEELRPGAIKVNSSKNYTISGNGSIMTGSLTKEGTGTLTISTENEYTGGNYLKGGTVKVNVLANDVKAKGNLGAVTTGAAKFTMENGATIQTAATVTNGSPIKLIGDGGGVINASAGMDFIQDKAFTGTVLTKKGTGWLKTYATGANLNKLVVEQGRVISYNGIPAKAIELRGGELQDGTGAGVNGQSTATTMPITVPEGKTGTFILGGGYYTAYSNKVTGAGTLTVVPTNTVSRVRITGDWSQFEGTIKHTTSNIWLPLDNSTGIPKGTLDIASGCTVTNTVGKTYSIGKLTGSGTLAQAISNFTGKGTPSGNITWQAGNSLDNGDFTFSGIVTDNGSNKSLFNKIGTCKMTISGAWTNSGAVQVKAGELLVKSGALLGTGALTVAAGATLSGVSKKGTPMTNSSFTINGTLHPGASASAITGNFDFNGKNVTFGSASTLLVGLRKSATATQVNNTHITNMGTLKLNAGATIAAYMSDTYIAGLTTDAAVPDSFYVWTNAKTVNITGDLKFDLPELPVYNYWDTSRINEGILYVRCDAAKYQEYVTGISAIESSEAVEVQVINASGMTIDTFTCPMGNVRATFASRALPQGIYLLRIQSETGKRGTLKVLK